MADDTDDTAALNYYRRRMRYNERLNLIVRSYMLAGAILALSGAGYVIYSKLKITLDQQEQLALAISFMGALTVVLSSAILSYRRTLLNIDAERVAEHQAVGRFIEAWALFEGAIRQRAYGLEDGAEGKHVSIRDALVRVRKEGILSPSDQIDAEGLLQFRNLLVHGAQRFPAAEIGESLKRLIALLSRFS